MPNTRRNQLVRLLAYIDQAIENATECAADPDDQCQQFAKDFLAEFQEARGKVESMMRTNNA